MLRATLVSIFEKIWPMILIFCVVLASIRLAYLVKNNKKIVLYKEILSLGFVIYILCLFYVVTFQDVSWSTSNYIPFKEMFRYNFGTKLFFKNVVGNMIMFVPYGFFVSYFLKLKKPYLILVLTLFTSATIETTQSIIGRVFDIDDILLNLTGGVVGFYLYLGLNNIKEHLPKLLKNSLIYNIIIILVLLGIILYLLEIINVGV
jgi:glycopeptide antibiotics resistance protein